MMFYRGLTSDQRNEVAVIVHQIVHEQRKREAELLLAEPELPKIIPDAIAAVREVATKLIGRTPGLIGRIVRFASWPR